MCPFQKGIRFSSCVILFQEIHSVVVLLGLSFFGYIWGFTGELGDVFCSEWSWL